MSTADYVWELARTAQEAGKVHTARYLASRAAAKLPRHEICAKCSAILEPGVTARVRLRRRTRRSPAALRKITKRRRSNLIVLKVRTHLVTTCLLCGHRTRQLGHVLTKTPQKKTSSEENAPPLDYVALPRKQQDRRLLLDPKPRKRRKTTPTTTR